MPSSPYLPALRYHCWVPILIMTLPPNLRGTYSVLSAMHPYVNSKVSSNILGFILLIVYHLYCVNFIAEDGPHLEGVAGLLPLKVYTFPLKHSEYYTLNLLVSQFENSSAFRRMCRISMRFWWFSKLWAGFNPEIVVQSWNTVFVFLRTGFPFQNNPKNLESSNKMDLDFWECISWMGFPFQNNPENLESSNKMDLDFWDCFNTKKSKSASKMDLITCI